MRKSLLVVAICIAIPTIGLAQTTTLGPEVDVEIYNPADGSNLFKVAPGKTFWAYVLVRPGLESFTCQLDCGGGMVDVPGGSANIAAALIDIAFDPDFLEYLGAENNPTTAAVDGLSQEQHLSNGRIGWALAGDWTPDADPASGSLANPCEMARLTAPGWVFRIQFRARSSNSGETTLHIRRETDSPAFELSFADVCGSPSFKKSNATVDEIVNATVSIHASDRTRPGGERREPEPE
jgi:hypothetical protein